LSSEAIRVRIQSLCDALQGGRALPFVLPVRLQEDSSRYSGCPGSHLEIHTTLRRTHVARTAVGAALSLSRHG